MLPNSERPSYYISPRKVKLAELSRCKMQMKKRSERCFAKSTVEGATGMDQLGSSGAKPKQTRFQVTFSRGFVRSSLFAAAVFTESFLIPPFSRDVFQHHEQ